MSTPTVRALARQERAEFADFLDTLTPKQWSAASLCEGWTVRDVVVQAMTGRRSVVRTELVGPGVQLLR
jgi:uncharacterized protein (TIGR03083 family)